MNIRRTLTNDDGKERKIKPDKKKIESPFDGRKRIVLDWSLKRSKAAENGAKNEEINPNLSWLYSETNGGMAIFCASEKGGKKRE